MKRKVYLYSIFILKGMPVSVLKPKVVHFTTVHKNNDPRIFHRQCKSLASAGYPVVLLAQGKDEFSTCQIQVKPLGVDKGRWHRMTLFQWTLLNALLKEKAQIYHFHDPELMLIAILLKLFGKKVIYDVHEDLPADILLKSYIPKYFRKSLSILSSCMNRVTTKIFNQIITVTPNICKSFKSEKAKMVRNFPDLDLYANFDLNQYLMRRNMCVYIGSITLNRGIYEMLSILKNTDPTIKINLSLAGPVANKKLQALLEKTSVSYEGYLDYAETPKLLATAKIGLLLLHPEKTFQESLPLKLFEYMAAGLPVIASNFELWSEIISEYQCGLLVDPCDEKSIAEAVDFLINNPQEAYEMGQRGRKAIEEQYNWKSESIHLLEIYNRL